MCVLLKVKLELDFSGSGNVEVKVTNSPSPQSELRLNQSVKLEKKKSPFCDFKREQIGRWIAGGTHSIDVRMIITSGLNDRKL